MTEYIEREKVIQLVDDIMEDCKVVHKHRAIRRNIKQTPAADVVEVRHGKFKLIQSGKGVCSNCHRLDSIDKLAKYCRYCGALMDGKDGEK